MNTKSKDVSINFPEEGLVTSCEVEELGEGLYKLLDHPIMAGQAKYGDTIRAEIESPGQLKFLEVVEESDNKMFDFILSKEIIESEKFKALKERLNRENIFWQQDFGGCFMCFIPKDCTLDIEAEIGKIVT